METQKPTAKQIETALNVLLWLFEQDETDGATRDEISRIRDLLWRF